MYFVSHLFDHCTSAWVHLQCSLHVFTTLSLSLSLCVSLYKWKIKMNHSYTALQTVHHHDCRRQQTYVIFPHKRCTHSRWKKYIGKAGDLTRRLDQHAYRKGHSMDTTTQTSSSAQNIFCTAEWCSYRGAYDSNVHGCKRTAECPWWRIHWAAISRSQYAHLQTQYGRGWLHEELQKKNTTLHSHVHRFILIAPTYILCDALKSQTSFQKKSSSRQQYDRKTPE